MRCSGAGAGARKSPRFALAFLLFSHSPSRLPYLCACACGSACACRSPCAEEYIEDCSYDPNKPAVLSTSATECPSELFAQADCAMENIVPAQFPALGSGAGDNINRSNNDGGTEECTVCGLVAGLSCQPRFCKMVTPARCTPFPFRFPRVSADGNESDRNIAIIVIVVVLGTLLILLVAVYIVKGMRSNKARQHSSLVSPARGTLALPSLARGWAVPRGLCCARGPGVLTHAAWPYPRA